MGEPTDTSEQVPLRIYIASKSSHGPAWQTWRAPLAEMGVEIISTWIDESGPGDSPDMTDLWRRVVAEASSCDLLVAVHFEDEVWKGAFVEIGAALAHGHPVYVVGRPPASIRVPSTVTFAEDITDAVDDYRRRHDRSTLVLDIEQGWLRVDDETDEEAHDGR